MNHFYKTFSFFGECVGGGWKYRSIGIYKMASLDDGSTHTTNYYK